MRLYAFILLFAITLPSLVLGEEPATHLSLVMDSKSIAPGQVFNIGARFSMNPGWHIYWRYPGEAGLPTSLTIEGSDVLEAEEIEWPVPERFYSENIANIGYSDQVMLILPVAVGKDAPLGPISFEVTARWLDCNGTLCMRRKEQVSLSIEVSSDSIGANQDLFSIWKSRLPKVSLQNSPLQRLEVETPQGNSSKFHIRFDSSTPLKQVDWFPIKPAELELTRPLVSIQEGNVDIAFSVTPREEMNIPSHTMDSLVVVLDQLGEYSGYIVPVPLQE